MDIHLINCRKIRPALFVLILLALTPSHGATVSEWLQLLGIKSVLKADIAGRIDELVRLKHVNTSGPNCVNAAFYALGLMDTLQYTTDITTNDVIKSSCHKLNTTLPDAPAGALIILRRIEKEERPIHHAFVKMSEDKIFEKASLSKDSPYEILDLAKLERRFRVFSGDCSGPLDCPHTYEIYNCSAAGPRKMDSRISLLSQKFSHFTKSSAIDRNKALENLATYSSEFANKDSEQLAVTASKFELFQIVEILTSVDLAFRDVDVPTKLARLPLRHILDENLGSLLLKSLDRPDLTANDLEEMEACLTRISRLPITANELSRRLKSEEDLWRSTLLASNAELVNEDLDGILFRAFEFVESEPSNFDKTYMLARIFIILMSAQVPETNYQGFIARAFTDASKLSNTEKPYPDADWWYKGDLVKNWLQFSWLSKDPLASVNFNDITFIYEKKLIHFFANMPSHVKAQIDWQQLESQIKKAKLSKGLLAQLKSSSH